LNGDILSASKTKVDDSGRLKGNIVSDFVEIGGYVEGDVFGNVMISLKAGAKVYGNLYTTKLVIEKGFFFDGESKMDTPPLNSLEVLSTETISSIASV
jgi:cytoskeletal protein CcmA (bactofilin family)